MIRVKRKLHATEEFDESSSSDSDNDSIESSNESEISTSGKAERSAMLLKQQKKGGTRLGPENAQNEFGRKTNHKKVQMDLVERPSPKKLKGQHKQNHLKTEESHVLNSNSQRNKVSPSVSKLVSETSEDSESEAESSSEEESDTDEHTAQKFYEKQYQQDSGKYSSSQNVHQSERLNLDEPPRDNNSDTSDEDHDEDDDYKAGADESEAGTEQDEYSAIRKELADIPFEDLLKIKEKVGVKAFNKILHGNVEGKTKQKIFKRESRHKPREMSSKRPVPVLKNRTAVKKWVARDPRFDDLSGEYREYHFNKNYSFLEDIKEKEREVVKKQMKNTRNDEKKRELKGLLNRLQQEQQVKEMKKKHQDLEKMYVEKEREMVKEGKTPYFLKKSDKKTLELAMKFKELKQAGRLDSYMSKKRKKVAQKQRKKMPSQQSGVI